MTGQSGLDNDEAELLLWVGLVAGHRERYHRRSGKLIVNESGPVVVLRPEGAIDLQGPAEQVDGDRAGYRHVEDHGTHAGPGVRGDDVADDSRRREDTRAIRCALEAVDPHVSAQQDVPASAGAGRVNDL
jgi:hypothetical protein